MIGVFNAYIGSVKHEGSKETELVQSFVIGGGTITQDTDADADGLKDWQELVTYNTDWLKADTDQDGLHDAEELKRGTDPKKADTDGDGLKDGWEILYGFDPLSTNDAAADPDKDGLTNLAEQGFGTNPLLPDEDGDGCNDSVEIMARRNPKHADGEGDLNGDCFIDLRDVILALRISSGIAPSATVVYRENEVNRDQRIDIIDVLYILQRMAGFR